MLALAVTWSSRLSTLQPTAVSAILAEVRECEAQGKKLVSLMRGEPDLPTPGETLARGLAQLRQGLEQISLERIGAK